MHTSIRHTVVALASAFVGNAFSTTYYVNPNSWGDTNPGTSAGLPWKTIDKVNKTVVSGDTVYFFRGGIWYDTLRVTSGVTYGAYGSNANKPVISGSRNVGGLSWARTSAGSNIWVATTNAANANIETGSIRHLYLNGTRLTRARFPNVGQKGTFDNSTSGPSRYNKVTLLGDSTTLNVGANVAVDAGTTLFGQDITGATAFVRTVGSDLFEYVATGWKPGSNTALDLAPTKLLDDWDLHYPYPIAAGVGYWLENKKWMLNSPGEWYFENIPATPTTPAVHKLYVWMPNGASPAGQPLFAASQAYAVEARNISNVAISDIEVRETQSDAISMSGVSNVTLARVDVNRAGRRGVSIWNASNVTIRYANIQDSYGNGLWLGDQRGGATASQPVVNANVSYSTINNSGQNGLGMPGVNLGVGGSFTYNTVTNSASAGVIALTGTTIQNNTVLNSCTDFEDCGAIYVAQPPEDPVKLQASSPTDAYTTVKASNNLRILNNIVSGGNGNPDGTPGRGFGDVRGIYLDDYVNGVTVSNNYVSGVKYGIMLHTAFNNTINDNLIIANRSFNLKLQEDRVRDIINSQTGVQDGIFFDGKMVGNTIRHNAMVANKDITNPTLAIPNIVQNAFGSTAYLASFDLNNYATVNPNRPEILVYNYGSNVTNSDMTLADWQGQTVRQDAQGSFRMYQTDGEAYGFYTQTGAATRKIYCPAANTANCHAFVNLLTGAAVTFPFDLPANSSIIVIR